MSLLLLLSLFILLLCPSNSLPVSEGGNNVKYNRRTLGLNPLDIPQLGETWNVAGIPVETESEGTGNPVTAPGKAPTTDQPDEVSDLTQTRTIADETHDQSDQSSGETTHSKRPHAADNSPKSSSPTIPIIPFSFSIPADQQMKHNYFRYSLKENLVPLDWDTPASDQVQNNFYDNIDDHKFIVTDWNIPATIQVDINSAVAAARAKDWRQRLKSTPNPTSNPTPTLPPREVKKSEKRSNLPVNDQTLLKPLRTTRILMA